jgi:prepilin-type N-terminal cleavage/methylation domain-containing protein
MPNRADFQDRGFSLLELIIVVVIILILAAISVPAMNRAISTARVRGAAVEYSNLMQTARLRAISDDRFYFVYVQPAAGNNPPIAYVDIYPQVPNGISELGAPLQGATTRDRPLTP